MGFLNKIKDILFEEVDEEEVSRSVKPREVKNEVKKPIAERIEPQRTPDIEPVMTRTSNISEREPIFNNDTLKQPTSSKSAYDDFDELSVFKPDNNFPFQDFDEQEFSAMSRVQKPKPSVNVMDYEKKKRQEKKYEYSRHERVEKLEPVEKKKFKPSPIISPVFGVLNEDYRPEDIKDKTQENEQNNKIDFNSVRKKAFEQPEVLVEPPKEVEEKTVKLRENVVEKQEQLKTVDELLEDTADVTIDVDKNHGYKMLNEELDDYVTPDNYLEDTYKNSETKELEKVQEDEDTLENDLFDLIDSMYEDREEGDY